MGKQNQTNDAYDEEEIVTLTLDDDSTIDCVVCGYFEADGQDYIALLPTEGEDADKGQVYLYRYAEDSYGEPILENIEDDEEFEVASDAFDQMLDSMEFDELVDGEDSGEDA